MDTTPSNDNDGVRKLAEFRRDNAVAAIIEKLISQIDVQQPYAPFTGYRAACEQLAKCAGDPSVARLEPGQMVTLFAAGRLAYRHIRACTVPQMMADAHLGAGMRGIAGFISRWAKIDPVRFGEDPHFDDNVKLGEIFTTSLQTVETLNSLLNRRLSEARENPEAGRKATERDQVLAVAIFSENDPFRSHIKSA